MPEQSAAVPPLTDLPPSRLVYSPAQIAARRRADMRRAAAMVDDFDVILGMRFRALTPATYSRLFVIGSPFLAAAGDVAARAEDVRDYLWIHSPDFQPDGKGRTEFVRRLLNAIDPAWLRWRRSRAARQSAVACAYALAAVDIRERVEIAFADEAPGGGDGGGTRIRASLEAALCDAFARAYGWDIERTRNTPLRKLYQFLGCRDGVDFDKDEAAVIAEELRQANAERLAQDRAA